MRKIDSTTFTILCLLFTVLLGGLSFDISPVRADWTWTETIYIRADGGVDPSTAPISTVDNVTYTLTDNIVGDIPSEASAVAIERDNIVFDGDWFNLEGTGRGYGLDLSGREQVEIKSIDINGFSSGIRLWNSSYNTIRGVEVEDSSTGISLLENSSHNEVASNTLIGGYEGSGISMRSCTHNNISRNTIYDFWTGVNLHTASYNRIFENDAFSNHYHIELGHSDQNRIYSNDLWGTLIDTSIKLRNSEHNRIYRNSIDGDRSAVSLYDYSMYNKIYENEISSDDWSIDLQKDSSNNVIFHNNFEYSDKHVHDRAIDSPAAGPPSINVWDNGYPSGGNYWDNYTGTDGNFDGIGDTPHSLNEDNIDQYPLMGSIKIYDVGMWDGASCEVHIVNKHSIYRFRLNEAEKKITFNSTGSFCRITIPKIIIEDLWESNYTVLISGQSVEFSNWTDDENTYIYVAHSPTRPEIAIIPEIPFHHMLPIFMIVTLVIGIVFRREHSP